MRKGRKKNLMRKDPLEVADLSDKDYSDFSDVVTFDVDSDITRQ